MAADFLRHPRFWVAAVPLAGLVAGSVIGSGGFVELWRLRRERAALSQDVYDLLRENGRLRQRIASLRRSDRDVERLARRELGLVRDGEIVYRFRPPTTDPPEPE